MTNNTKIINVSLSYKEYRKKWDKANKDKLKGYNKKYYSTPKGKRSLKRNQKAYYLRNAHCVAGNM